MLDGDELGLVSLALDGREHPHEVAAETLTLRGVPDAFVLKTVTRIVPQKNTKLEGLYATQAGFVTQCEAQGFRRITWYVDRPDNLAADIRVVREALKVPVTVALLKGRSNYVCHYHLERARHEGRFPTRDDARYLPIITNFAMTTALIRAIPSGNAGRPFASRTAAFNWRTAAKPTQR